MSSSPLAAHFGRLHVKVRAPLSVYVAPKILTCGGKVEFLGCGIKCQ